MSSARLQVLSQPVIEPVLEQRTQHGVLPEELEFYQSYDWCLNPYVTVNEAIAHLGEEVDKLSVVPDGWQIGEISTNIFLLSSGLLNCFDEHLLGVKLRLPKRLAATFVGRGAGRFLEAVSDKPWSRRRLARWRGQWLSGLNDFLSLIVREKAVARTGLAESGRRLMTLLEYPFPTDLQARRLATPVAFRRLDLTQRDCLSLGAAFVRRFPDRTQPILLLGLRTTGSYVAPLLRAFFEVEGYRNVALMTIEPKKGPGRREKEDLKRFAARDYWALIVDDAPASSYTVLDAFDIAHRAGFAPGNVKFLVPTHPANPSWYKPFPEDSVVTLAPEQWHKRKLLIPKVAELRLAEYFRSQNFVRTSVTGSHAGRQGTASGRRGQRLKRVFQVQVETPEGEKQTKYVLAKSVGWGWLGYHALLIGHRLSEYVPRVLGLRDGVLYSEWIPQPAAASGGRRETLLEASASYVAARVRRLNLAASAVGMDLKKYENGNRILAQALSRAYGGFPTNSLARSRIGGLVRKQLCPCPTLIDANMHPSEWIRGPDGPLKTDYEHHGIGRYALNVIDPAYDLADTILNLALSPEEERRLITHFVAESGDSSVTQRLFTHKLVAGLSAMSQSHDQLFDTPRGGEAQRDRHRRFMNAWNFLTVQAARRCGSLCQPRNDLHWHAPIVVLDIDGVLDRGLFGFPCTTAAGIKALSLLNAHEFSVALNTARSAAEVKEYCKAYSLVGGIAESGSYLWDAVRQREQVLISAEAERQLAKLRTSLQRVPGVFLDERHRYSIRAFTYRNVSIGDGVMIPISTHIVHELLEDLRLDQLAFRETAVDIAIVAKEVDKGTGLVALRDWVLARDAETIAVGDDEPDLAMFRVATRSFAPSNIGYKAQARLLGCQIAPSPYQRGLLDIVTKIIHPAPGHCERCTGGEKSPLRDDNDLFLSALQAADQSWSVNLLRSLRDPVTFRCFIN
jgi:hydroxymethylpyrimidine pyrophosphatase-like HAD family hydrolase